MGKTRQLSMELLDRGVYALVGGQVESNAFRYLAKNCRGATPGVCILYPLLPVAEPPELIRLKCTNHYP
jgi:hypothetical protein